MAYGLTNAGFIRKRLDEIKAEIEQDFRDLFGNIDTSAASVFGQIIGILSERFSDLWEVLEALYYSQYPASAEGVALDNAVSLSGFLRRKASKTKAPAVIITEKQPAAPGTGEILLTVPSGKIASIADTGVLFEIDADYSVKDTEQLRSVVEVVSASSGVKYSVTINASTFDYTAGGGDDEIAIAAALVLAISGGPEPVAVVDSLDGTFLMRSDNDDRDLVYSIVVTDDDTGARIKVAEYGSPAIFYAQNPGAVEVVTGTLTVIETPVTDWDGVTNIISGVTGADPETDSELRARRERDLKIIGAGTVESIRARILQEVTSVTQVFVKENRTSIDYTPTGLPPHSINVIVDGGDDDEIAQKIWETKPAGIQTYGSESGDAVDSEGVIQTMYFDRPETRFVYMRVTLTLNPEQNFPSNGVETVKANIEEFGNALQVGDNLIIQSFFGPIFDVPGIATAVIEWAEVGEFDPPPTYPGDYSSANIAISASQIARFSISRITIPTPT